MLGTLLLATVVVRNLYCRFLYSWGPRIVKTECVRCDDCERVDADQAKRPHSLIPVLRERNFAAARAAGQPD
jgi:hypothetical protein